MQSAYNYGKLLGKFRELGLTQAKLAELIGVSASRVSEYLSGKSEPTLRIAKEISAKLDIDPALILGV